MRNGHKDAAWSKYCGFIDLSLADFMQVQERLLAEQWQLLANCSLGRKLLGDCRPQSVNEFRKHVPLTTYEDYLPYLEEKREDVLPASLFGCTSGKPASTIVSGLLIRTPGWRLTPRTSWPPLSFRSVLKGDFTLKEGFKFLHAMAPPPYLTGMVPYGLKDEFRLNICPPLIKPKNGF